MTDLKVNSFFPAARSESTKSTGSDSDFLFSLKSVSTADVGNRTDSVKQETAKASSNATSGSQETGKVQVKLSDKAETASKTDVSSNVRSDGSMSLNEKGQSNKVEKSVDVESGSAIGDTRIGQTVGNADKELSELQNQKALFEDIPKKQPMLDLDRILEKVGEFIGNAEETKAVDAVGGAFNAADEALGTSLSGKNVLNATEGDLFGKYVLNGADSDLLGKDVLAADTDSEKENASGMTETDLFGESALPKDSSRAPMIDLNRILKNLEIDAEAEENVQDVSAEIPQAYAEENREITTEPILKVQTDNVLPQIDFNRILESVKGLQEESDIVSSTDSINQSRTDVYAVTADEAGRLVKDIGSDAAYSEKIASNVAALWDNLAAVIGAAQDFSEAREEAVSDLDRPIEGAAQAEMVRDGAVKYGNEAFEGFKNAYGRFAENVRNTDKPSTLDQLKAKLAEAMAMAVAEMSDPGKQAEEMEEKILEFLLKFLEKMNEDDEDDKTSDGQKKAGDLGILLQIIENLTDEIKTDTRIEDGEESVFEAAPIKVVENAAGGFGADVQYADNNEAGRAEINGNAEGTAERTAVQSRIKLDVSGAAENAYANAAAENVKPMSGNADKANSTETIVTVEGSAIKAVSGSTAYIAKAEDDPEDIDAKADKVLSKPNRDGKIRSPKFSSEFEELKRLFGDTEKKKKEELPEDEEDEENKDKIGSSKGNVTLDEKSKVVSSLTLNSAETDETALAKSFDGKAEAKEILTQIASEILNNEPKEKKTVALVMTLNPESLGKITLKITEQAGKLNVIVTAHNKETAEILASRMDGLQEALKDSGTQLEKYQVVYGPEQEADAKQQSYEGSSKNPYVRNDDDEGTDKDGEFSELLKEAV